MANFVTVFRLAYMNLRTQMEYRLSFFIWLGIKVLSYGSEYLIVWMVLDRFKGIGSWSIPEVIVLWAILQLSYTLAAPFLFHSAGNWNNTSSGAAWTTSSSSLFIRLPT